MSVFAEAQKRKYQHKLASVVGQCVGCFATTLLREPRKCVERLQALGEKYTGFTHIACAIVLVFLVAVKADTHPPIQAASASFGVARLGVDWLDSAISGTLSAMPELRKDPMTGQWVIIAAERARRPQEFLPFSSRCDAEFEFEAQSDPKSAHRGQEKHADCPFCEGNESETTDEVAAIRSPDTRANTPGWRVRVVPNKYPALVGENDFAASAALLSQPVPFVSSGADTAISTFSLHESIDGIGVHEVIIESPEHLVSITDLTSEHAVEVFSVYRDRLLALRNDPRIAFGLVFKNCGAAAGASIEHIHSQLIGLPLVPSIVRDSLAGASRYWQEHRRCLWCDMIEEERCDGTRIVMESEHFLAMCPYASRLPYQTSILPRQHASHFEETSDDLLAELSEMVRQIVGRMQKSLIQPAYNYMIRSAPFDTSTREHYHWYVEVFPRLTMIAGFEWGTGCFINPVTPEYAAKTLRNSDA